MKNLKAFIEQAQSSLEKEQEMKNKYATQAQARQAAQDQENEDAEREDRIVARVKNELKRSITS